MRPGRPEIFWSYKKNLRTVESRAATSLVFGKARATERTWDFSLFDVVDADTAACCGRVLELGAGKRRVVSASNRARCGASSCGSGGRRSGDVRCVHE